MRVHRRLGGACGNGERRLNDRIYILLCVYQDNKLTASYQPAYLSFHDWELLAVLTRLMCSTLKLADRYFNSFVWRLHKSTQFTCSLLNQNLLSTILMYDFNYMKEICILHDALNFSMMKIRFCIDCKFYLTFSLYLIYY